MQLFDDLISHLMYDSLFKLFYAFVSFELICRTYQYDRVNLYKYRYASLNVGDTFWEMRR